MTTKTKPVRVQTEVTVCIQCGKVAILRSRPWKGDWRFEYRPIDGKTHSWECPDGHGSQLTKVTCRGTYTPPEGTD